MRNITIACLTYLLLCNISHGDVYIDEFSTTQVLVSTSGYVSGPGILGTERDVAAYSPTANINSAVPGQFLALNNHPQNWGTIFLTYDGVDQNTNNSFLNGLANVDLTEGGANDCFRIGLTSATSSGGSLTLTLRNVGFVGSSITVLLPTSASVLELPFADFTIAPFAANQPIDFANVGHIELELGLFPGESYTFDSISTTVPEPNSATLLAVTGIAIAVRQFRKPKGSK